LRDVLHSRALSITPDVDAIDRIHAGARRRQRRQRRQRVAVSGGAALAVIAVAVTGVTLRPTHHNGSQLAGGPSSTSPSTASSTLSKAPSPVPSTVAPSSNTFTATGPAATTPATIPAGGAPPAGFTPMSVTAVNANTYWVLGHAPCASGSCTALAKTTDGGKTFAEVGAPPSTLVPDATGTNDATGTDTISDVRFVDGNNGWAFGGGLWQTTDGGQHWTQYYDPYLPIMGIVQHLAVASGKVWAIASTNKAGATPSYGLFAATYPGGKWTLAQQPIVTFGGPEPMLAVQGKTVTVIGTDFSTGKPIALRSTDGQKFSALPTGLPCTSAPGDPLSSTPKGLWLACSSSSGKLGGVYFSPDFGKTWQVASSKLADPRVAIGGVDDKSAIVATGGKLLRVNVDGSTASVSTPSVPASTQFAFIGFTTANDGFAVPVVNGTRQLWRTTDGGAHWSVVKF
jgi:photosystem II stability/assembly factor-like uncharacterized protein